MNISDFVNAEEIKKTIATLKEPGELFEVRILGNNKRKILSGYFTSADTLLNAFKYVDLRLTNIYISLNRINTALYSREQKDRFVLNPATTNDTEVTAFEWFFVDLDPIRPAGISSSEEEFNAAREMVAKVQDFLYAHSFGDPVIAESGNGLHLLYKIEAPATKENAEIIKQALTKIGERFNNDLVKIDAINYNPSRICKLHGTLAQKGANTQERPFRMSRILDGDYSQTDFSALVNLANLDPAQEPVRYEEDKAFDLVDFLSRNNLRYNEKSGYDCRIYELDECPFNSSHKHGDSKIFHYSNGAIAFKCHHNSCKDYKWQDVRLMYEPDAYDDKNAENDARIEAGYQKHKELKQENNIDELAELEAQLKKTAQESRHKIRDLKKASELMSKDLPEPVVYVGVGSEEPILVEGTCVLSAKPKLGKSWLALALCVALANGEDFLGYQTRKCSTLYLDLETSEQLQQKRLRKVLDGRPVPEGLYLESETNAIDNGFVEQIEHYLAQDNSIGFVVIDVFQLIRSKMVSSKENEYEKAYRDISPLNELAQKYHLSIVLVCHDRKATNFDDPFENILGSTGLQGAATQMIVMYRKTKSDPITMAIKGKTIDSTPELYVKLENGQWSRTAAPKSGDSDLMEMQEEFEQSTIRKAVNAIAETFDTWRGRCSQLSIDANSLGFGLEDTPKSIGTFLHRHIGRFRNYDKVLVEVIDNGTGPKIYKISKLPLMTIDEHQLTFDECL